MLSTVVEDLAVDDGVFDPFCLCYQPPTSARKVAADLRTLGRIDAVEVKNRDVGREAGTELASIAHPEESGGFRGDAFDGMLERECLFAAHEIADEISRIPG